MGNAKKTKNKAQQQVLAFAPGYGEGTAATRGSLRSLRNNDLGDLPGARREVRAIADYADGDFYIERGAKELSFKQKAENYRIIHLAMHGTADHENPLNSRLIFHTPTDSLEDGTLYAYEIYGLDLNTDMVVLSACETGTGQYANGEGVMSLGRAFMYAGASSVVQTSWEIPDKKSAQLMNSFYQSLSEGMDKASALQQAKLDYLSSSTKSDCHPFFWASFAAYGDVTPIKLEKQNSRWYWLLLIPVVLLGVWLLYRKFWRG